MKYLLNSFIQQLFTEHLPYIPTYVELLRK